MLGNNQLTQKEKLYIQDQIKHESLCMAKCDQYIPQCQDNAVRNVIQQVRDSSKKHVDSLSNLLQEAGFTPPS
ncbi:MAG: DUF3231 family protein [Bacillota bacterium]